MKWVVLLTTPFMPRPAGRRSAVTGGQALRDYAGTGLGHLRTLPYPWFLLRRKVHTPSLSHHATPSKSDGVAWPRSDLGLCRGFAWPLTNVGERIGDDVLIEITTDEERIHEAKIFATKV